MTRAAALKKVIRARAAKTGERYTTARRHVLNELKQQSDASPRVRAAATPPPHAAGGIAKGALSEAKALERTGHGLAHWFDVLDRFGGVDKGHTAAARHLSEAHKIDGWYAQGITVAYERALGVRAPNQRVDGVYEVSISKVVDAKATDVIKAFSKSGRRHWTKSIDANLVRALAAGLDSTASKGFVVRPDGLGRFRYKWDDTTVQFYLVPQKRGNVSVVVTNSKLRGAAMVEERRSKWRTALNALAERLSQ